jgi:uncharacterized protein YkwD
MSHAQTNETAQWHVLSGFHSVGVLNIAQAMPARQSVVKNTHNGILARSYLERVEPLVEEEGQHLVHRNSQVNVNCRPTSKQRDMLRLVNQARAKARHCGSKSYTAVPPLSWNCALFNAALAHTQDMIDYDYFDHEGSDGSSVGERVERSGYSWKAVGENIAAGYPDNELVMKNWISSPTHCENIMDPKFTEFASALIATDQAHYYNYWTQVFAAPIRRVNR